MSIDRRVRKLNRFFVPLGTIPYGEYSGQSIFQYKRANELRMPYKKRGDAGSGWTASKGGILMPYTDYELGFQGAPKDDYWTIAKWLEAGCDEQDWTRQFPNLGYPKHGYFTCFQPLKDGKTPDENFTAFIVDHIKYQMEMKPQEHYDQIQQHYERRERDNDRKIEDMLHDALHMNVPGKRGGLVSYPQTRHTR